MRHVAILPALLSLLSCAAALNAQGPPVPPVDMPRTGAGRVTAGRGAAGRGPAAAIPPYRSLTYPALRPFQPPKVEAFQLPNGLKVYLSEDHDVPLVSGTALIRTGGVFDPPGK